MSIVYVIDMIQCTSEDDIRLNEFWRKVADSFAKNPGFIEGSLQKSLNPQSKYQYASICKWQTSEDYLSAVSEKTLQALFAEKPSSVNFESALYTTHTKIGDEQKLMSEHAILVNPFEVVDESQIDACLTMWNQAAEYLEKQPGFVSSNLCQSLDPKAKFRFINIAEWETAKAFLTAVTTNEFQSIPRLLEWPHHPTICNREIRVNPQPNLSQLSVGFFNSATDVTEPTESAVVTTKEPKIFIK